MMNIPHAVSGSWAYVETQISGKAVRGFIPFSAIN
jgi:hypothetical protein